MNESIEQEGSAEFLEKFGYRSYQGKRVPKWKRILSLIYFEVRSTWDRSTFGKVLFIIIVVINAFSIIFAGQVVGIGPQSIETINNTLHSLIASYMLFFSSPVQSGTTRIFSFSVQIGILLVALFAIAGSGMFADDKQGKVIEVYMSRMRKLHYTIGKLGSIILYINIFLFVPLVLIAGLRIQSFGLDHLEYLDFYAGILLYSVLISLIIGLGILSLSVLVEKRHYASLSFVLIYILANIFGNLVYSQDPTNEFLLLAAPDTFISLLAYVCLGDFELGISNFNPMFEEYTPLVLDDGAGLEYWHVLGLAGVYIAVFSMIIIYKINKLTTEEL